MSPPISRAQQSCRRGGGRDLCRRFSGGVSHPSGKPGGQCVAQSTPSSAAPQGEGRRQASKFDGGD